ncbi:hypothetical protein PILCRDRAFT_13699 [Piloderma croceum F 1598]|uniref:FHA domain-containing protein n=1 Tax=Piloderma croceum (strain F 1598) TaxID=765440 RepID=A0A0C3AN08_PILCF|nr:hypothetical protein PILCRDRAFT_13699 [Piloderma croceum F 1598]
MAVIMEVIRTFSIGGKWKKLIGDGDGLQEIIEIGIESKETGGIGSGEQLKSFGPPGLTNKVSNLTRATTVACDPNVSRCTQRTLLENLLTAKSTSTVRASEVIGGCRSYLQFGVATGNAGSPAISLHEFERTRVGSRTNGRSVLSSAISNAARHVTCPAFDGLSRRHRKRILSFGFIADIYYNNVKSSNGTFINGKNEFGIDCPTYITRALPACSQKMHPSFHARNNISSTNAPHEINLHPLPLLLPQILLGIPHKLTATRPCVYMKNGQRDHNVLWEKRFYLRSYPQLQGRWQKSRETGTELYSLTGTMNGIHNTLGAAFSSNPPICLSALLPV